MPTVITHAAVPLCIGLGLGSKVIPPRLLFAGIILAMLPDADVLSFKFGIAYGNVFGHRGFTHSLVFAFVVPLLCVLIGRRWFRAGLIRCWLFLTVSLLSHSLLDSVTTGGKGVGWLWPWSDERFFAPWQVIKVAPFALSRYTTPYGHQVIISELMWVWLPGMVLMGMLWWRRRYPDAKPRIRQQRNYLRRQVVPCGPSSSTIPISLRRSRAASAAAQSFALRASRRC